MSPLSSVHLALLLGATAAWAAMAPPPSYNPPPSPPQQGSNPPGGSSECAAKCVSAYRTCQGAPNANQATCAAEIASCAGYNPFPNGSFVEPTDCSGKDIPIPPSPPAPVPDKCAEGCITAFRTCQGNRDNNRATCAANLASCVGYVPFDNSGTFVTPTACSSAPSTATTTPPGPTSGGSECAQNCVTAFRTCQGNRDNTRATCAANLASCVGYVPFDNSGTFVTPTACSTMPAGPTAVPTGSNSTYSVSPAGGSSACAQNCYTAYRNCQGDANANRATCAAGLTACVGYNPFDNTGSFVTPTACLVKPANTTQPTPAIYTGGASLFSTGGSLVAMVVGAVGLMV